MQATRHDSDILIGFCLRSWAIALLVTVAWLEPSYAQLPTNNNPSNQIRFTTAAEADSRRDLLVNYIWNAPLPTSSLPALTPNVAIPAQATGVSLAHVDRVDRLSANVSGWDFHQYSYLMHPKNQENKHRLAIVYQGHADTLLGGVGATADHLLARGFTVLTMEMPLYGWNTDTTANLPGQGAISYGSHDQMILNTGPANGGWARYSRK